MTALSRELVYALQIHPNCPLASAGTLLVVSSEGEGKAPPLGTQIKMALESTSGSSSNAAVEVKEIGVEALVQCGKEGEQAGKDALTYEAAILSNVLHASGALDDDAKLIGAISILLTLLKPNGVVVLREDLGSRPARLIARLTQLFDMFSLERKASSTSMSFQLYSMNQVQDSINTRSNFLDVYWTLCSQQSSNGGQKQSTPNSSSSGAAGSAGSDSGHKLATFREFLDKTQYTEDNVQTYEYIFGENFISPGGLDENRRVLNTLCATHPGQRMLDIGVGIGGGARQAAAEFGFRVLGCDLSSNMIVHAFERVHRDKDHRVEYQICDAMVYQHEANSFDCVYSRDCIQHIKDTESLFQRIYNWLKPGGQLLITCYGLGHGHPESKFLEFVRQRQYYLRTQEELQHLAQQAGFVDIYVENRTVHFKEILLAEREKVVTNKEEFMRNFSPALYEKLVNGWADKLRFVADDNHNWLLVRAKKPLNPAAWATISAASMAAS